MDDEELLQRVAQRDEDAFRALYLRHSAPVYGLLCRLAGRNGDAAELLQETWLRALRHLPLFRGQCPFQTWLTGIALNCYRDARRRHQRDGSFADADAPPPAPAAAADERVAVAHVLTLLAPDHRELIVLHDIEGFTPDEIAAALECDAATTTNRLARARRSFRQHWSRSDDAWSAEDEARLTRARVDVGPEPEAQESLVMVLCARGLLRRRRPAHLAAWSAAILIVVLAAVPLWLRGCS